MARNYAEELDTWVSRREVTGREKNLVAFHAVRDDIQTALAAGFAVKTIWAHMRTQGRIGYGYNTFRFYVNRFIKKPQATQPGELSGQGTQTGPSGHPSPAPSVLLSTMPVKSRAGKATGSPASVPACSSPASSSTTPPPTRRTGMPTFKFNPIPQREDNP
ncbi:MAG: traK [Acetobacteraceae bacterium]|nr:MAG: traK [Acetobacteraceae bacterium]